MRKFLTVVLMSTASASFAQCWDPMATVARPQAASAVTRAEASALATHMASVKSRDQLTRYMKMTPASKNPLAALSTEARKRFIESLTFNEKGLTGYRYSELENELTPTQISNVLALFGTQENTSLFKKAPVKTAHDQHLLSNEMGCDDGVEPGSATDWGNWGGAGGAGGTAPPPYPPGPSTPQDYSGYRCESRGNCKISRDMICLKTC